VKSHEAAYIIGVDTDWAVAEPTYADIILTSVTKNLDASVVLTVKAIEEGTFTGGVHIGSLETGEVGLAPFHELDSLVSAKVKAELEQIRKDIIAGKIRTRP
jgi:basic membrane protein A